MIEGRQKNKKKSLVQYLKNVETLKKYSHVKDINR